MYKVTSPIISVPFECHSSRKTISALNLFNTHCPHSGMQVVFQCFGGSNLEQALAWSL